jgi:plasmid stability protein
MKAYLCYHAGMARQLTIRGVPDEVAERLTRMSRHRGRSVNATVLEILEGAVGLERRRARLERYATWTDEDLTSFEEVLRSQRVIDDELWR